MRVEAGKDTRTQLALVWPIHSTMCGKQITCLGLLPHNAPICHQLMRWLGRHSVGGDQGCKRGGCAVYHRRALSAQEAHDVIQEKLRGRGSGHRATRHTKRNVIEREGESGREETG